MGVMNDSKENMENIVTPSEKWKPQYNHLCYISQQYNNASVYMVPIFRNHLDQSI